MSDLVEVKTIGEVERIVHASGLWDGTGPVEFSDDGHAWTEAWAPTTIETNGAGVVRVITGHPTYARVTVYRKDVRVPTTVTIRWDEQVPSGENIEWFEKWHAAPMRHFGRTARMVGFRQTFRDLLGNIVIEDEDRASAPAAPEPAAPRDWAAEFRTAAESGVDSLDAVVKEARAARVFKPNKEGTELDRLWKQLRADLLTAAAEEWEPAPGPSDEAQGPASAERLAEITSQLTAPELTPDEQALHAAFFEQEESRPVIRNRADRRAAARKKKGGRR